MTAIIEKKKEAQKIKPPSKWRVVFFNDDFTSFEFVIFVLVEIFNKTVEEAAVITQEVHQKGQGTAGVYTKEIAATLQHNALELAKENEFPLKIVLQEE